MNKLNILGTGLLVASLLTACGNNQSSETTAATNPAGSTEKTLTIATEANYPPFNALTSEGKIVGFDVDVMNAICEEMKAKCNIVQQDWNGLLPGLMAQKYDAVIAGMSITPERLQQVDFSTPYFSNKLVWLAKDDGSFDPKVITNSVLGSQRSTTAAAFITDKYDGKNGNRVQLYDTYINAYLDLKSGRVKAVMAEKASASDWLNQGNTDFGFVGDEIDNNDNLAIAVRKGDTSLEAINHALITLKNNGKLSTLQKKYFDGEHTISETATAVATAEKETTASTTKP